MPDQMQNRYTKRRLEIRRRRERRNRIISGLAALSITSLMAVGIGFFCRQLLMRYPLAEIPVMAETPSGQAVQAETELNHETDLEIEDLPQWSEDELADLQLYYSAYVHGNGWNMPLRDNSFSMAAAGEYITAMNIRVENQAEGMTGTIEYDVNVSGSGWQGWISNGETAGMTDVRQPLEALRARFTGELGECYDVYYSVFQDGIWTEWVKNGADAGQAAAGKRVDGFRIASIKKADEGRQFPGGVDPSKPMVALTYDDGPNRPTTTKVLDILEQNDARATFFMVGDRVAKFSDVVSRMSAAGCELANHTMNHTDMRKVGESEYMEQLRLANEAVYNISGVTPVLMRPCEGALTERGLQLVGSLGMSSVMWNVDTRDWSTRDAQQITDMVLSQVKDGDIILMHDLYESTVIASETIVPELKNRGFQLVTVSELAACRGGLKPGRNYGSFPQVQ